MRIIIIGLIKCYQKFISVYWPNRCRFYPSCSEYMIQAIDKMGIIKGIWLGLKRIGRCHPFNPGGIDIIGGANESY